VTEDSAAELFEPLRTHSRARKSQASTAGKELRARGLSTDSTTSSGINAVLEGDLDSSMEWGEDSQDGHAVLSASAGQNAKVTAVSQVGAQAATAAPNKGRFNKRKFGSPLPSRPASAVFFSTAPSTAAAATVPASAEVAAALKQEPETTESAPAPATRTRKRGAQPQATEPQASLAPDSASAPSKYAKVTPEAPTAGSGRDELYWKSGSGDTPAGKIAEKEIEKEVGSKTAKGKAAAKEPVAPVVAVPVRRSTRGAK
jgi:hypothetical protein